MANRRVRCSNLKLAAGRRLLQTITATGLTAPARYGNTFSPFHLTAGCCFRQALSIKSSLHY